MVRSSEIPDGSEEPPDETPDEHRLLEILACYDDAIVEGIDAEIKPSSQGVVSGLADRLQRDEAVINLLAQAGMGLPAQLADVLSKPIEEMNGPDCATDPANGVGRRSPKRIGRFEIIRELGRGGLGVVFLARDPVLKRNVALKLPRPEALLSDELRRRFLQEAQAIARLTHPNLVPAFEVGERGPLIFLASNYVEGPNLANWLDGRAEPPPHQLSASWMAALADAVHYAHCQGVLHRDITPSNIILKPPSQRSDCPNEPAAFTPQLVDFGLAKVEGSTSVQTRAGMTIGTLGYMSPEQAEARLDEIGPATDVYALGAVLYHLLTGSPPYAGPSTAVTLKRMFASDLVSPRQKNAAVSRDLEAICLRCLERLPEQRYATAGELAADLRLFLAGEPTSARPLGVAQRLSRWVARRPMTAALVSVSCLGIATIACGSTVYSWRLADALALSEQRRLGAVAMRIEADDHRRNAAAERDSNEQL